jgi:hypothetical protein
MIYATFREVFGWVMLVSRELFGWLLIAIGFCCFYGAYRLIEANRVLYLWAPVIVGIVLFRGGIHLLKVAVAAKICQQTQDQLYPRPLPGVAVPQGQTPANTPLARRP